MADLRSLAAYDGCGPVGQQCVESKSRSYEATAGPLAPGTRALVKRRAIPRGHSGSGPTRPRSRAPSHVTGGPRQLRTLDQEIEGSNPSSPAIPQRALFVTRRGRQTPPLFPLVSRRPPVRRGRRRGHIPATHGVAAIPALNLVNPPARLHPNEWVLRPGFEQAPDQASPLNSDVPGAILLLRQRSQSAELAVIVVVNRPATD
jgi:hypothetical protein